MAPEAIPSSLALSYLLIKPSLASEAINVPLFTTVPSAFATLSVISPLLASKKILTSFTALLFYTYEDKSLELALLSINPFNTLP
nr:MAG TPA: hypothetical protein [Caudoviricetes sp.]